jgi:hypothetical protein
MLYGYPEPRTLRVHKFAHEIHSNLDFRKKFQSSPDETMIEYGLTDEEREVVKSRDSVRMAKWGLTPYAIAYIEREAYMSHKL